jgi:Flp pilus assembly protein TadD
VNPEDAHAQNALAVALAGTGDFAAARTQLRRARAIDASNTLYEQNLRCLDQDMRNCHLGF